jgi:CHASE1-domain containing sensor protein
MNDVPERHSFVKIVLGLLLCGLAAYGLVTLIARYT